MEIPASISIIFNRVLAKAASAEELNVLAEWIKSDPDGTRTAWISDQLQVPADWSSAQLPKEIGSLNHIPAIVLRADKSVTTTKQYFIRRKLFRYVAVAIFVLAIGHGIYYLNNPHSKSGESGKSRFKTMVRDITPGTNRAILTINNNQNIDLETNKTGININNTITYNDGEKIADAGQLLQLTTPRGGQYQAVLPDGSKVWLNAASSIKFPSKFNSTERKVEVTGEAYFEIAKDAKKPFKVFGGGQEIEVLGTSFNINIYNNEPVKKTTLITGSIKITSNNRTAILQPGEQANIPITPITKIKQITVQTTNIEQDIAWKNGFFNLQSADIQTIMRTLSRWYNVEVEYKRAIESRFTIDISRNTPLSDIIKILEATGKLKIEVREGTIVVY